MGMLRRVRAQQGCRLGNHTFLLARFKAFSPAQIGHNFGVFLQFLRRRSRPRPPGQVRTHSQPMPADLRTASSLAPSPLLWRSRRASRSSQLPK
jgi:hypothetical protein